MCNIASFNIAILCNENDPNVSIADIWRVTFPWGGGGGYSFQMSIQKIQGCDADMV